MRLNLDKFLETTPPRVVTQILLQSHELLLIFQYTFRSTRRPNKWWTPVLVVDRPPKGACVRTLADGKKATYGTTVVLIVLSHCSWKKFSSRHFRTYW